MEEQREAVKEVECPFPTGRGLGRAVWPTEDFIF